MIALITVVTTFFRCNENVFMKVFYFRLDIEWLFICDAFSLSGREKFSADRVCCALLFCPCRQHTLFHFQLSSQLFVHVLCAKKISPSLLNSVFKTYNLKWEAFIFMGFQSGFHSDSQFKYTQNQSTVSANLPHGRGPALNEPFASYWKCWKQVLTEASELDWDLKQSEIED